MVVIHRLGQDQSYGMSLCLTLGHSLLVLCTADEGYTGSDRHRHARVSRTRGLNMHMPEQGVSTQLPVRSACAACCRLQVVAVPSVDGCGW